MSRYLEPTHDDFHEGSAPRWFRTRYKKECQDLACASVNIGVLADDFGKDPAITAISTTVAGDTTNYGNCPTQKDWSSRVEAMIFRVEIENNTAGTLLVDLEFYRAVYGDSGGVEDWQKIDLEGKGLGLADGEEVVVQTDRSSIFVRIAGYTNPDSNAQLHISCMLAAVQDVDVDGEQSRIWGWCSSVGRWVKAQVSTAGRLLTSEENSADIKTAVEAISTVSSDLLEAQMLQVCGMPGVYSSPKDFTAAYRGPDTITLTLGALTAPSDEQLLAVWEKVGGYVTNVFLPTKNEMTMTGSVLKVSGASFTSGAEYVVAFFGQLKGYNSTAELLGVYLGIALDETNDNVTSWIKAATGLVSGSSQISNAAATALNGGTSLTIVGCLCQCRSGNSPIALGDSGILGVNEGAILPGGASLPWDINDIAKIYGWATVLNERIDWLAATR